MKAPDAKRIVKMLGCIPPANRKEVFEDLLGLHSLKSSREAILKAPEVQAALTSLEQSNIKNRGQEYPLRALVRRESGKFWAFETGVEGGEILVLLLDEEIFKDKSHTAASVRGTWNYFIFKTGKDYLACFGEEEFSEPEPEPEPVPGPEPDPDPEPEKKPGCSLPLVALVVVVVGFGLSGLVSRCNGKKDNIPNHQGTDPSAQVTVNNACPPARRMCDAQGFSCVCLTPVSSFTPSPNGIMQDSTNSKHVRAWVPALSVSASMVSPDGMQQVRYR